MSALQLISIFIEGLIFLFSLYTAVTKKKIYAYSLALTFLIYLVYDLSKLYSFDIPSLILDLIFFIASISALFTIWKIYKETKRN